MARSATTATGVSNGRTWPSSGALAGACGLLGLAVIAAAVGAPWTTVNRFPGTYPNALPFEQPSNVPTQVSDGPTQTPQAPTVDLWWLPWLLGGVAALGLLLLVRWLARRYRATATPLARPPMGAQLLGVPDVAPDLPALRRGITSAESLLDEIADPADAIVAAWLAVEAAAASSGLPREPAQTPTEFTTDVLSRTPADPAAVTGLLRLYHRARFSSRAPSAADVGEARRLLGGLARSWAEVDAAAQHPERMGRP